MARGGERHLVGLVELLGWNQQWGWMGLSGSSIGCLISCAMGVGNCTQLSSVVCAVVLLRHQISSSALQHCSGGSDGGRKRHRRTKVAADWVAEGSWGKKHNKTSPSHTANWSRWQFEVSAQQRVQSALRHSNIRLPGVRRYQY